MFFSGLVLIMGVVFIAVKLPIRRVLWLLGHHVAFDVFVFILMTWIHWGTFSGLMAAAFAGMMCSLLTTFGRYLIGYIEGGKFVPGIVHLKEMDK